MNDTWFQVNASVVGSLAGLALNTVVAAYLQSLRPRDRDAVLFTRLFWLASLQYGTAAFHDFTSSYQPREWSGWLHVLILSAQSLYHLWFAYQIGGNPFRPESRRILSGFAALSLVCFGLFTTGFALDDLTFVPNLLLYPWIVFVFRRKAALASDDARRSGLFRGCSRWTMVLCLTWVIVNVVISGPVIGIPVPVEWHYYLLHPLQFASTVWSALIFLRYTSQPTSFQAKLSGLILAALLMFIGMAPVFLSWLTEAVPGGDIVTRRMLWGFIALIPAIVLLCIKALPAFLRLSLLAPLSRIADGVREVDAGRLPSPLPTEVHDEIGALTLAFNHMTASLRSYREHLEALVATRTQELEDSLDTLRTTQNELIRKEKLAGLGEVAAGIAHEIQNPLNFVVNFAGLAEELAEELRKDVPDTRTDDVSLLLHNLRHIGENGRRASDIVRNMLIHSYQQPEEPRQADLNELILHYLPLAYEGFRNANPGFSCILETDLAPELPAIPVSRQDLGRVLLNLLTNAFQAVPVKSGIVRVRTTADSHQIQLSVRDNGPGIAPDLKDRIFQPFFTTKPPGTGTGLGLSICYDIVTRRYGGDIRVVSETYTEFLVELPL